MTLLLAVIIAASGHAAGYAKGISNCKEAKQIATGWAVPPPSPEGRPDLTIRSCFQDWQKMLQLCAYVSEDQTKCVVMVDKPGEERWAVIPVNCADGKPLQESKL